MDDLMQQMGMRLFVRRKQLRLTQEELAEAANVTSQTISTAELGKKALRPENIVKICTALEISTDYLLYGRVTADDRSMLMDRISKLAPNQYRHLEDIVSSYLAAVSEACVIPSPTWPTILNRPFSPSLLWRKTLI